jgi:Leucine-rich repeat (LRR) protein
LDAAALQPLQQLSLLSSLTMSSCSLHNQDMAAIAAALPQLQALDASNNRISKAEPLTGLVSLTCLNLSRNPLQLNSSKVLAGLPLQSLALFDAAPARGVSHLAGAVLTQHLTSLTLGSDPSLNPEGTDEALQLSKTRTCSTLFGALAESERLQVLSVPCTGLGDAQGKLLGKLGASLQALNIRCVGGWLAVAGLGVLEQQLFA